MIETGAPNSRRDGEIIVKSLDRAIDVLEALARSGPDVPVTALAAELELPKSSVFRVLNTFKARGYVQQDRVTERYSLGTKFLQIAHAIEQQSDVRTVAMPYLRELQRITGETVHFAVPVGHAIVYIDKVETSLPVRMAARVGQAALLHSTALGKAYLAALPQEEMQALLKELRLTRRTDRTIVDRASLRTELATTRQRGFALDDIENEEGVRCVGAPVVDRHGHVVACLSVSAPASRFSQADAMRVGLLCAAMARTVSASLGAGPPGPDAVGE